jgi:type-F conjugative transfer system pilin assembly thiol-disulfide isomerase TrbB
MRVKLLLVLCLFCMPTFAMQPFEAMVKEQGFFFFYSSSCQHCQTFAPILQRFSKRHGFKVLAISMDGGFLNAFPNAVINQNQAAIFEVKTLPTLFLMNPQTQTASLVTEGSIDEKELTARLLKISQGKFP